MRERFHFLSFSKIIPPLVGVPPKKYVEDIPEVQWEVHAKFGLDPSSSLGGEWRQTNKQTDTPFCFLYIDFYFFEQKRKKSFVFHHHKKKL